jgi:acyl-CoA thioester hydrolase
MVITARGVVRPSHCDHMGHMNVMWYTARFDEATWHLFHQIGVTPTYMRENQRGMAGVQIDTTYKQELFAGDLITIWSRILEMREKVIRFYHEMHNEETQTIAATSTLTAVHLNRETRKSCAFPAEILERGKRLILRHGEP